MENYRETQKTGTSRQRLCLQLYRIIELWVKEISILLVFIQSTGLEAFAYSESNNINIKHIYSNYIYQILHL